MLWLFIAIVLNILLNCSTNAYLSRGYVSLLLKNPSTLRITYQMKTVRSISVQLSEIADSFDDFNLISSSRCASKSWFSSH